MRINKIDKKINKLTRLFTGKCLVNFLFMVLKLKVYFYIGSSVSFKDKSQVLYGIHA